MHIQAKAQGPGESRGAHGLLECKEAREGQGVPAEAEVGGGISFEQGSLNLSIFLKSR